MKHILYAAFTFLLISNAHSTVWTVSNDLNRRAQFTDFTLAHAAASINDTIYIYGSATTYSGGTLSKRLVIIGPGYNPTSSNRNNAYISISFATGSSNSIIYGLVLSAYCEAASTANNIRITRCNLPSLTLYNSNGNWIIENCIINSLTISQGYTSTPLSIRNNIITGSFFGNTSNNLITIQNNLFVNTGTTFFFYSPIKRATIKNNIFYGTNPGGADSCFFLNNLTWDIPITSQQTIPYGSNTGTGNIIISNPLFVNVMNKSGQDFFNDFRLSTTSPAKNKGSDGTDIGPTGGASPLYTTTGPLTGMPPIPSITEMYLPVNAAPQGGNIQLFIRGKRNN
ncbi:MAG: hypothetical protein H7296_05995 [Bacteroidia bacterium]|nr:hypothetical protein [Bacteroidia bacterium]